MKNLLILTQIPPVEKNHYQLSKGTNHPTEDNNLNNVRNKDALIV